VARTASAKGPIERFLDLLNGDADLKARFLEDPDAVMNESGIELDAATREVLASRDPKRVRGALVAEIGGAGEGEDDHMYDIFVPPASIEWADSAGKPLNPVGYEAGLAFLNLYGWEPDAWVAVQVDGHDISAASIDQSGHTPFFRPFPFQWPAEAYREGDHVVDAYAMDDPGIRAESITVTVTAGPAREQREAYRPPQ
jgi:hypothetical protein